MASWRRVLRGARRRRSARTARSTGFVARRRPARGGRHRRRARSPADAFVVAAGRVDAAAERAARLPRADPAGQGLLDHDAAAGALPDDPADLRGAPRRRHADAVGLPPRLDDGVRRLRRDARPAAARAAAATAPRRYLHEPDGEPVAGGVVRLAADDARRPADHRPQPGAGQRRDRRRATTCSACRWPRRRASSSPSCSAATGRTSTRRRTAWDASAAPWPGRTGARRHRPIMTLMFRDAGGTLVDGSIAHDRGRRPGGSR